MKSVLDALACVVAVGCVVGCLALYVLQATTMSVVGPTFEPVPSTPLITPQPTKITIYLFTQANCAPCDRLKENLRDPRVKEYSSKFDLQEVDVYTSLATRLQIDSTPTLAAMGKKGVKKEVGYLSKGNLINWFRYIAEEEGIK